MEECKGYSTEDCSGNCHYRDDRCVPNCSIYTDKSKCNTGNCHFENGICQFNCSGYKAEYETCLSGNCVDTGSDCVEYRTKKGSCKNSQKTAKELLKSWDNLPFLYTLKHADKIDEWKIYLGRYQEECYYEDNDLPKWLKDA